jgi:hypothetical protein
MMRGNCIVDWPSSQFNARYQMCEQCGRMWCIITSHMIGHALPCKQSRFGLRPITAHIQLLVTVGKSGVAE